MFVVHSLTAEKPFIDLRIFKDLQLHARLGVHVHRRHHAVLGLALLPPLLQNLMGYPVIFSSVIMAPRGVATFMSMMIVGRLTGKSMPAS